MPGLLPGIHVPAFASRTWMAGTKPGHDGVNSSRLRSPAWQPCPRHSAVQRLAGHFRLQDLAHRDELLDIDAGLESLALAQERQILHHHVAGRTRRERAAAEAAERTVQHPRAGVERG